MTRASIHGVAIAYALVDLPADPLGGFFALFPEPSADAPVDVDIVLRRADPAPSGSIVPAGYVPFFFHGSVQAYRGPDGLVLTSGDSFVHVTSDARVVRGFLAVAADGALAEVTEGLLHVALLWVLRERSLFDLHAAAAALPERGPVLIVGDSGAGKTTLMLALAEAGFGYLGDDRVLLRAQQAGPPSVLSYPRVFHVGAPTLRAFPRLGAHASAPSGLGDKHAVDPARAFPAGHRRGGAPPSLVLFPRIGRTETTTSAPLAQAEAFGQLLVASAIALVDGVPYRDEHMACLRELVSGVPAYELLLGRDLLADPVAVVRGLPPLSPLVAPVVTGRSLA